MATSKNVPESDIPEVAQFVETQERIKRLKEAYPEVFEQFDQLKDDYNAQLEAADKAVRSRKVSCGPFTLMSTSTKYNADKLFEQLGRKRFLEAGGIEQTVTVFSVDRGRLEAQIAANAIPADVIEEVRDVSPRYKKPEKITL